MSILSDHSTQLACVQFCGATGTPAALVVRERVRDRDRAVRSLAMSLAHPLITVLQEVESAFSPPPWSTVQGLLVGRL
jgi:hypothetical protein